MATLLERVERVRESVKQDMQGVSKLDASLAAAGIISLPGVAWIFITHWDSFLAYVASL